MTAKHLLIGRQGEELAVAYLRDCGWTVVERNFRCKGGELDIVARDGDEMVVVEVRTRSEGWMQGASESVGPRKLRRLVRTGRLYMDVHGWDGPWRIDIVAITLMKEGAPVLERIEGVTVGEYFS